MSGSFIDANAVVKADDFATAVAQIPGVIARVARQQAEAAKFVTEYGAAVVDGHTPVAE